MSKKKTKQRTNKKVRPGKKKQLLIGMYEVFDPAPGGASIGQVAVQGIAGGGQFDTVEHWAFLETYRGPGIGETLKVTRRTVGEPTAGQLRDFLTFLNGDPDNIYIRADCTQRAHPVSL